MPSATKKFEAHLATLCAKHGITLTYETHNGSPFANPVERRIGLNPITSDVPYAEALHEIGHLVVKGASPDPGEASAHGLMQFGICTRADLQKTIREEHLAWNWAMEHALIWTETMSARRDEALASYEKGLDELPERLPPFLTMLRAVAEEHFREMWRKGAEEFRTKRAA